MSGFVDTTMGVRAIGARTDSAGSGITDISAEEDRFANIFVGEGYISPVAAFQAAAVSSWDILIGSGATKTDYYVVEGQGPGQGNYVVRLDAAGTTVTVDASDVSNPRIDAVYLVVVDNAYDASGLSLVRLAVREGDTGPAPVAPGPDPSWLAYAVLAEVLIPAASADITEATITDLRIQSQSNVDAPTLEGNAAAAFSETAHDHAALYTPLSHVGSGDGHPDAGASDGMMSAADKLKLNAIEAGAEDNLTPTELRTLLKTVAGSGSGLDADLLDGQHLAAFDTSGHTHDDRYYTEGELAAIAAAKSANPQFVYIRRLSGMAFANNYESVPLFTDEPSDDWNGHVTPNGFINSGPAGYYIIEAQFEWEAGTGTGHRRMRLHKSGGAGTLAQTVDKGIAGGQFQQVRTPAIIRTGEVITLYVWQDSGSNLWIAPVNSWMKSTFLGAAI